MTSLETLNNQLKGLKQSEPPKAKAAVVPKSTFDILKSEPKGKGRGGKREGSGKKKGYAAPETLEKIAVLKAYRQRAMKHAEKLLNSQLTLANGVSYLFKISPLSKKPILVVDPLEIAEYLDNCEEGDSVSMNGQYYYITTAKPDAGAIDSVLDRTFGRPAQPIRGDGDDDTPIGLHIANLDELLKKAYDPN